MRFAKINGFIVILGIVIIGSCAKVGSPSGGPRDVDPPVVLESYPPNGTTNFHGNEFIITFNEYVVIDDVSDKLMVSPPLGKKPIVSMKGKSVKVEYEDLLKDSTTYTFYFQDAIKDLNEGNALENFQFVFSTGNVIDSLSLQGNIFKGLSLDPAAEVLVMLYNDISDTAFQKSLPDYITKATKEGNFRIDNIREGKYRLFGLEDQDNSKNFNIEDEVIAFYDSIVNITPENDNGYSLYLFQPEKTQRYLTSTSRNSANELRFSVSLPPAPYSFGFRIPESDNQNFVQERTINGDTLTVWLLDTVYSNQQSLKTLISYPFTDSTGTVVQRDDTINLRFTAPRTIARNREVVQKTTSLPYEVMTNFSSGKISPLLKLNLTASTPFGEIDHNKISLYEIKDTLKSRLQIRVTKDSVNLRKIYIETSLLQGVDYLFVADSAAFKDIYGLVSDSLGKKFNLNTDDKYGKLIFRISGYDGPRIVQLLSLDETKTVREYYQERDGSLEIPYLEKGKYKLRVIYDLNGDKKWTPGDYKSLKQPEPVSYFSDEIEVKVNWEQIFDWDISAQNQKANRTIIK